MSIPQSVDAETNSAPLSVPQWRRAVTASQMPNGAKLTLLAHASRGFGHYHSPGQNTHAVTIARLMAARGVSRRSIQYHLRIGREYGFLRLHEQGSRGHQQVFHYLIPGAVKGATHYTLCDPTNCTPLYVHAATAAEETRSSTEEEQVVPPASSMPSQPAEETHSAPSLTVVDGGRVGTEPPEVIYAAFPLLVFALARMSRIHQEQTMSSAAFQNDQPLELGLSELSWPPEATAQGCRQAWHQGWNSLHSSAPDPTFVKRAMQKINQAAKDRTDLETWRNLWRAARDAGRAGVWNVDSYLEAAPTPRYTTRGNRYVDVVSDDAAAALGILGIDRQELNS